MVRRLRPGGPVALRGAPAGRRPALEPRRLAHARRHARPGPQRYQHLHPDRVDAGADRQSGAGARCGRASRPSPGANDHSAPVSHSAFAGHRRGAAPTLAGWQRLADELQGRLREPRVKKILLADDEPAVRRLVTATLADETRYQILEAGDGVEALSMARAEHP